MAKKKSGEDMYGKKIVGPKGHVRHGKTTHKRKKSSDITLEKNSLQLYPNPTSSSFYLSKEALDVEVYDITGKQVKQFAKSVIKNNTFSVTDLNTGIYFVRIKENDNKISTKKLIIN